MLLSQNHLESSDSGKLLSDRPGPRSAALEGNSTKRFPVGVLHAEDLLQIIDAREPASGFLALQKNRKMTDDPQG